MLYKFADCFWKILKWILRLNSSSAGGITNVEVQELGEKQLQYFSPKRGDMTSAVGGYLSLWFEGLGLLLNVKDTHTILKA